MLYTSGNHALKASINIPLSSFLLGFSRIGQVSTSQHTHTPFPLTATMGKFKRGGGAGRANGRSNTLATGSKSKPQTKEGKVTFAMLAAQGKAQGKRPAAGLSLSGATTAASGVTKAKGKGAGKSISSLGPERTKSRLIQQVSHLI